MSCHEGRDPVCLHTFTRKDDGMPARRVLHAVRVKKNAQSRHVSPSLTNRHPRSFRELSSAGLGVAARVEAGQPEVSSDNQTMRTHHLRDPRIKGPLMSPIVDVPVQRLFPRRQEHSPFTAQRAVLRPDSAASHRVNRLLFHERRIQAGQRRAGFRQMSPGHRSSVCEMP